MPEARKLLPANVKTSQLNYCHNKFVDRTYPQRQQWGVDLEYLTKGKKIEFL